MSSSDEQLNKNIDCGNIPVTGTLVLEWLENYDDRDFWVDVVRKRNKEIIRACTATNKAIEDKYNLKPSRRRSQK